MPERMRWHRRRRGQKPLRKFYYSPFVFTGLYLTDDEKDLVNDIEFEDFSVGPDERDPESGWKVDVSNGYVTSERWELTEEPEDEDYKEDWEENPVLKITTSMELQDLFAPDLLRKIDAAPALTSLVDLAHMWQRGGAARDRAEKVIDDVIGAYQSYYGGSEEWVSSVGE